MVYIKEAHAVDSVWPMVGEGAPVVQEPISIEERRIVARQCTTALELAEIPTLVDTLDDAASKAYAAWPDRLFLIGTDGKVLYRGGPGPFGFHPLELERAIRAKLGLPPREE